VGIWGPKLWEAKRPQRGQLASILQYVFHPVKAKSFGALNSILGKVGTRASERVLLHLTYSKCSSILFYGLEAIKISKKACDNLNYVHNSIFVKLFKSFENSIIEQCHYYMGYLSFDTALELRRLQFLENVSKSPPSPAN